MLFSQSTCLYNLNNFPLTSLLFFPFYRYPISDSCFILVGVELSLYLESLPNCSRLIKICLAVLNKHLVLFCLIAFFSFNWRIIVLQCCVSLCCTTMWISTSLSAWASYQHHNPISFRSSQSNELTTLCYTAGSHYLFYFLFVFYYLFFHWRKIDLQCFVFFFFFPAKQQSKSFVIIRIYPPSWTSLPCPQPIPLGHHREPGWAPCVLQQLLTTSSGLILHMTVYTRQCYFLYESHSLLHPLSPQVCSLHLHLHSFPANRFFINTFFLYSMYIL